MAELGRAYRTLVGVAVGCGVVIAGMVEATRAPIERKNNQALEAAIGVVLPGTKTRTALALTQGGALEEAAKSSAPAAAYLTRDGAGKMLGFAIPATGMGYQDQIRLLYGYDPRNQSLTGYVILESRETPGLGSRIGSDPDFLRQFKHLPVPLRPDAAELANDLTVVSVGSAGKPWEVDAISGATVSSRAVVALLNQSLGEWLPRIRAYEREH